MEKYRRLKGSDDYGGVVFNYIVHDLAKAAGELGFPDIKSELKEAEFVIDHLPREDGGPDWENDIFKEVVESGTGICMDVSWFFLEYYLHRRLLGQLGYFQAGSNNFQKDPWNAQKANSLAKAIEYARQHWMRPASDSDSLTAALIDCAWSSDGQTGIATLSNPDKEVMLMDDSNLIASYLGSLTEGKIIIILGSCGIELVATLRLATCLANRGFKVELHVKPYPCGVLGVTRSDVELHYLCIVQANLGFAPLLRSMLEKVQLELYESGFYASPYGLNTAPEVLKNRLSGAVLVLVLGEENYRRLCDDRALPQTFPFESIVDVSISAPTAALKVCRSPVLVGLREDIIQQRLQDPEWCVDRTLCVIQFNRAKEWQEHDGALKKSHALVTRPTTLKPLTPVENAQRSTTGRSENESFLSSSRQEILSDDSIKKNASPSAQSVKMGMYQAAAATSIKNEPDQVSPSIRTASGGVPGPERGNQTPVSGNGPATRYTSPDDYDFDHQGDDYYPRDLSEHGSVNGGIDNGSNSNKAETRLADARSNSGGDESPGAKKSKVDDMSPNDADDDEFMWSDASNKLILDAVLEDIGTKDMGKPYVKAILPNRALSAYEHFLETRSDGGADDPNPAESWATLTKNQRLKYEMMANQDKQRYDTELISRCRDVAMSLKRYFDS